MGVKPDTWIRRMAVEGRMIEPFVEEQVRDGVISYGLSSYGYDMRVADEFRIFAAGAAGVVDPKRLDERSFMDFRGAVCEIPPGSFVVARSVEYFRIPRSVMTIAFGKSTYSRCGVLVNITPFEPEWEGHVTFTIANTAPLPARIHAGEGIAQVVFLEADEVCRVSYADRRGKYQAQRGITPPRL